MKNPNKFATHFIDGNRNSFHGRKLKSYFHSMINDSSHLFHQLEKINLKEGWMHKEVQ
jgi:hypothetical protein